MTMMIPVPVQSYLQVSAPLCEARAALGAAETVTDGGSMQITADQRIPIPGGIMSQIQK